MTINEAHHARAHFVPMRKPEVWNMTITRIKLELARDPECPAGSSERGYEFAAPLDDDGHIVHDEWRKERERCRVIRFWPGEKHEVGRLVHRGGGWAFDYDPKSTDDDEPGFKFGRHS